VSYTDRTLTCVECGAEFTFSAEDQEYHASRGFTNEPKRCPTCREARRGGGGGGGGGSRGGGYGSGSGSRQMYPAVCADCGQQTEVPFEPRGDRPVYCRDCFAKHSPARGR
jgi:CxxC-x17-CxxC domain-containing protein